MADLKPSEAVLLCDGKAAFPRILQEIEHAEHHIYINMFIWRNDVIGRQIAYRLLEAADRGVRIEIVKDRYGIVCEYSEEDQTSFFHASVTKKELVSVRLLELMYYPGLFGKEQIHERNELRDRIMNHPNITVSCTEKRKDHSKFYIFDDKTMIFGGINIEDKENGQDRQGRKYRDYMICLHDAELVEKFKERRAGQLRPESSCFVMNVKKPVRLFEGKDRYLDLIRNARSELTIVMAYFAPIPEFITAIIQAASRGVRVRILVPKHANFSNDMNRRTMTILFHEAKRKQLDLSLYLSDDMTHAKLLMSESLILVGSCNITRNAFAELDELNYAAENNGSPFSLAVRESTERIIQSAHQVVRREDLSYDPVRVLMERTVM